MIESALETFEHKEIMIISWYKALRHRLFRLPPSDCFHTINQIEILLKNSLSDFSANTLCYISSIK